MRLLLPCSEIETGTGDIFGQYLDFFNSKLAYTKQGEHLGTCHYTVTQLLRLDSLPSLLHFLF